MKPVMDSVSTHTLQRPVCCAASSEEDCGTHKHRWFPCSERDQQWDWRLRERGGGSEVRAAAEQRSAGAEEVETLRSGTSAPSRH